MVQQNIFLKILVLSICIVNAVFSQADDQAVSPCELESLLRQLTNPDPGNEMHAAALRNQLLDILEKAEQYEYLNDPNVELVGKRTIGSLARNGLLNNGKRNIGAMARQGLLRASNEDATQKRSLATLAKNGQLPSREPDTDEVSPTIQMDQWMNEKRNLAAMARAGLLGGRRDESAWQDAFYKRTPMSMMRTNPHRVRMGKRNLAALARGNLLPSYGEDYKRNVGALARDWSLPTSTSNRINAKREVTSDDYNKRNIGALKNSPAHGSTTTKVKRSIAYDEYPTINSEMLEPVYQTPPLDYEELSRFMNEMYPYHSQFSDDYFGSDMHLKKRYLGSLIRDGWPSGRFRNRASKRNIGSLARLGLLRSDMNSLGQQRQYSRQMQDKRHLGALVRSDITTNPSDHSGQPSPIVNDAKMSHIIPSVLLAGQPLDFSTATGVPQNLDSPPSINAVYADHFTQPEDFSKSLTPTNRRPLNNPFHTNRFNFPSLNSHDFSNQPFNDVDRDDDLTNFINITPVENDDYNDNNDSRTDDINSIKTPQAEKQAQCLYRLHQLLQNVIY